ncbi:MAG: hypothetical protein K0S97_1072, partial [Chloroflexota bacterium]|nr:hypothetical protein [Chloroflexota bacterium]
MKRRALAAALFLSFAVAGPPAGV